jgi:membrane protease YdiL (CAAX protease family)
MPSPPLKFPCPLCAQAVVTAEHDVGDMFRCPYCGGMACVPESAALTEEEPTLRRYVPPVKQFFEDPLPEPEPPHPRESQGPRPWGIKTIIKFILLSYLAAEFIKLGLFALYWGVIKIAGLEYAITFDSISTKREFYFTPIFKISYWIFSVWLIQHIVSKRHGYNLYEALRIIRPSRAVALKYGVFPALILVLVMIFSKFIYPPSFLHLPTGSPVSGGFIIVMLPVLIGATLTAIASPMAEEIIFRGFIYAGLKNQMNVTWAATITTVLFFIIHLPFNNLANATLIGLLAIGLMVARIRTNSTTVPMILHYIYNLAAMAASWITAFMAD